MLRYMLTARPVSSSPLAKPAFVCALGTGLIIDLNFLPLFTEMKKLKSRKIKYLASY